MRIWSLHPHHLDAKGLVALWRETLLAQHVLLGKTKGYKHHPQLIRFQQQSNPVGAIDAYLLAVYEEAVQRGYQFDKSKIGPVPKKIALIAVSDGQVQYEWEHLKLKLKTRDPERYASSRHIITPKIHPLFKVTPGPIATWERN